MRIITSSKYIEQLVKNAQQAYQGQSFGAPQYQKTPLQIQELLKAQRQYITSMGFRIVKEEVPPNTDTNVFVVQNKFGMTYNVTVKSAMSWQVTDYLGKLVGNAVGINVKDLLQKIANTTPEQQALTQNGEQVQQPAAPTGAPNPSNSVR